jgi:hypothetical protein
MTFHGNLSSEVRTALVDRTYGQTDGRTDGRAYMTKVAGAFRDCANAPKKQGAKTKAFLTSRKSIRGQHSVIAEGHQR